MKDNIFNFVKPMHNNKAIIISSNIFFTNQMTFVPLLLESDKVWSLSLDLENISINFLIILLFKN